MSNSASQQTIENEHISSGYESNSSFPGYDTSENESHRRLKQYEALVQAERRPFANKTARQAVADRSKLDSDLDVSHSEQSSSDHDRSSGYLITFHLNGEDVNSKLLFVSIICCENILVSVRIMSTNPVMRSVRVIHGQETVMLPAM